MLLMANLRVGEGAALYPPQRGRQRSYSRARNVARDGNKPGGPRVWTLGRSGMTPARRDATAPEQPLSPDAQRRLDQSVLPHLDAAYNLASYLLRDAEDAQDVVQESCLKAMRHFGGFRGGDGRAWLLAIVRNGCFTQLRRRCA